MRKAAAPLAGRARRVGAGAESAGRSMSGCRRPPPGVGTRAPGGRSARTLATLRDGELPGYYGPCALALGSCVAPRLCGEGAATDRVGQFTACCGEEAAAGSAGESIGALRCRR